MSSAIVVWIVAIPLATVVGIFLWLVWNNNRKLDARLRSGDSSLLSSSSYKITEVIRAPAGSRVEKIAALVPSQNMPGYIQQRLPDGRVAMIPVMAVPQPMRVHQSTTHTTQQLQEK